jgi:hypothetical protein
VKNRIRYQTETITIPNGDNQKELSFSLDRNFGKCVGFGIPAPLDATKPIHTTDFFVSIQDPTDTIQDRVPGVDLMYTPNVAIDSRLKKADLEAAGKKPTLKMDTNGVAVGSDFSITVVFALQNP